MDVAGKKCHGLHQAKRCASVMSANIDTVVATVMVFADIRMARFIVAIGNITSGTEWENC